MSDGLTYQPTGKLLEMLQKAWDEVEINQKFKAEDFLQDALDRKERNKKIKEKLDEDLNT